MEKNVLIVGGGIAGLSAGCYARMNGYQTSIFEMHSIPGGLCTAWERKDYKFDISMHMLIGAVSGPFHEMWRELGISQKFDFHSHNHVSQIEGMGKSLFISTERVKLERALLAISPEDEDLILEFTRLIFGKDMMKAASLKPATLQRTSDKAKQLLAIFPLLRTMSKYGNLTIQQFAAKFRNPFLREAIRFFIDAPGWPMVDFPMVALAGFMRTGVTEAPAPLGGSQKVVYHMADLFKKAGGELHLNSRVSSLILKNDRVTGIEMKDGTRHMADHVIWAGDGHTLIYDILGGKYLDDRITNMHKNWIPVKPILHVMMGVNMDLSEEPHQIIFEPEEPISIAGREHRWLTMIHHCFDPSMAPHGKSAGEVWYDTEYDYWEDLYKDRESYKAEKKRIADYTIGQLNKRWPGFASKIEVCDVPTPATYKRYTGNWQGSPDGWYVTPENLKVMDPVRTLPGLEGLQMVGQWTGPFMGTVVSALSGRQAVQLMCKDEGKPFNTRLIP